MDKTGKKYFLSEKKLSRCGYLVGQRHLSGWQQWHRLRSVHEGTSQTTNRSATKSFRRPPMAQPTESAEEIVAGLQRDVARLEKENRDLRRDPLTHWLLSIVHAPRPTHSPIISLF